MTHDTHTSCWWEDDKDTFKSQKAQLPFLLVLLLFLLCCVLVILLTLATTKRQKGQKDVCHFPTAEKRMAHGYFRLINGHSATHYTRVTFLLNKGEEEDRVFLFSPCTKLLGLVGLLNENVMMRDWTGRVETDYYRKLVAEAAATAAGL